MTDMAYMVRRPYSSTLGSLAHATVSMVLYGEDLKISNPGKTIAIFRRSYGVEEFDVMLFAAFKVKVEIFSILSDHQFSLLKAALQYQYQANQQLHKYRCTIVRHVLQQNRWFPLEVKRELEAKRSARKRFFNLHISVLGGGVRIRTGISCRTGNENSILHRSKRSDSNGISVVLRSIAGRSNRQRDDVIHSRRWRDPWRQSNKKSNRLRKKITAWANKEDIHGFGMVLMDAHVCNLHIKCNVAYSIIFVP
ncbi:hypothetical protein LXL04_008168 [Taraxacum kok-saghyz]